MNVIKARKKYDVQYPNLYAPSGHKHAKEFNSVQRAHQNTLESMSTVLTQMLIVGLWHPKFAAACGAIWQVGRIVYGLGYALGPDYRKPGGLLSHVGDLPLHLSLAKAPASSSWKC